VSPRRSGHWKRWLLATVIVIAALVIGGPFIYFHFIEGSPPPRLTLPRAKSQPRSAESSTGESVDGAWTVASGSRAGYRVDEVLFGQRQAAVGRTTAVTGQMTIANNQVSAVTITVDLTKVTSDQSRRDNQFQGRIMDTARYPTATFTLTGPIDLGTARAAGALTTNAAGTLQARGTTRAVEAKLSAQGSGGSIQVSGSIPVTFADWNIPNPSFGPATTADHGLIEFLVTFART
jgi:polyisoprenoid-binding protein YceI